MLLCCAVLRHVMPCHAMCWRHAHVIMYCPVYIAGLTSAVLVYTSVPTDPIGSAVIYVAS